MVGTVIAVYRAASRVTGVHVGADVEESYERQDRLYFEFRSRRLGVFGRNPRAAQLASLIDSLEPGARSARAADGCRARVATSRRARAKARARPMSAAWPDNSRTSWSLITPYAAGAITQQLVRWLLRQLRAPPLPAPHRSITPRSWRYYATYWTRSHGRGARS